MGSKRVNLNTFVGMSALLVIVQPTYVGLVYHCMARIDICRYFSVLKGLKLTCMNESGPVFDALIS